MTSTNGSHGLSLVSTVAVSPTATVHYTKPTPTHPGEIGDGWTDNGRGVTTRGGSPLAGGSRTASVLGELTPHRLERKGKWVGKVTDSCRDSLRSKQLAHRVIVSRKTMWSPLANVVSKRTMGQLWRIGVVWRVRFFLRHEPGHYRTHGCENSR